VQVKKRCRIEAIYFSPVTLATRVQLPTEEKFVDIFSSFEIQVKKNKDLLFRGISCPFYSLNKVILKVPKQYWSSEDGPNKNSK
jgi:hypothetical protein